MKISQQLKATGIGIFLIGTSSLVSVYLNSLGNDSKVVNYAGIVRGGTQRLIKLELADRPNDKLIRNLDGIVSGLIDGDPALGLPKATDLEFRSQMQEVNVAWLSLKEKIAAHRQNSQLKTKLLVASEKYFELANKTVFTAENYAREKTERLRQIQIAIFMASLVMLSIIWLTVDRVKNILERSTGEINNSFEEISSVVNKEEISIEQQAIAVHQVHQAIGVVTHVAIESQSTSQNSVKNLHQMLEILAKTKDSLDRESADLQDLKYKLNTVRDYLISLEKQIEKVAIERTEDRLVGSVTGTRLSADRLTTTETTAAIDNLRSSLVAMTMVAKDSQALLDVQCHLTTATIADLTQAIAIHDRLLLTNENFLSISDKSSYNFADLSEIMNRINIGAQETAKSILQIKLKALDLGRSTTTLRTKI
jgi:methyl-accepting chemotaxis protein